MLPSGVVTDIAKKLLDALETVHRAHIVPRDAKPANVMIADDGTVLLTDFGIAYVATRTARITLPSSVMGTFDDVSPEQMRGDDATPASDLYSLGATLYHALEGISPFQRRTMPEIVHAVLNDTAATWRPRPCSIWASCTP
ncbi:MAG TPA: serine/threonine-protein kinase [Stackebrandtia sp.]|uniref:serine/threonine-protein kinase n=1 Tax=Stackebrandtia sp. TaxID=2023065 RepID=UPI002D528927|nr:serine/threonine-protein kinase [Stackebrandtia sp.]HZE39301.1 serine/threonine-protein kinase [Stackebrandtia sp.]